MASIKNTLARVSPTNGVWEHRHGDSGWHWACAGHRDNGEIHKEFKADQPVFAEGTDEKLKPSYFKALNREEGFVSKVAGKEPAILVKAS